jgi:hypothetical protein
VAGRIHENAGRLVVARLVPFKLHRIAGFGFVCPLDDVAFQPSFLNAAGLEK